MKLEGSIGIHAQSFLYQDLHLLGCLHRLLAQSVRVLVFFRACNKYDMSLATGAAHFRAV
jgi:hypothetical protein